MDAADVPLMEVATPRSKPWSRSSSIGRSMVGYTSLRDVLDEEGDEAGRERTPQSWRAGGSWGEPCACCHDASLHDLDGGARNHHQLLRRAASAYLQSAVAVVAAGDGGPAGCCCLSRLWCGGGGGERRARGRVLLRAACSSWQGCVDDPAEACAALVARAARRVAAFVAGRVSAVWAW
ncbi:hypothetical protein QOZ80_5AG0398120 [Eleusine coracana subsp. coracana]|nr:hypothetical protein QOZ80_5AG0398120 [Eleusine coracana subsp. coracana]